LKAQKEMKDMTPDQINTKSKQMSDQIKYSRDSAIQAKQEGNQLFRAGKNAQAIEKYTRAADALKMDTTSEAQTVLKACWLNAAACRLKLEHWHQAEDLCDLVLETESNNLKALFRRGQARSGLGLRAEAIQDLEAAAAESEEIDPQLSAALELALALPAEPSNVQSQSRTFWENKSISEIKKELVRKGVDCTHCTEKGELVDLVCSGTRAPRKKKDPSTELAATSPGMPNISADQLEQVQHQMKQNPAMMKQAAEKMANMSESEIEHMSQMCGQKFDPAMAKNAAAMMRNMSPEQMTQQMEMAQSMQSGGGEAASNKSAAAGSTMAASGQPQMTAEMAAMAGDMMKNISAEDMATMMDMSKTMQQGGQPSMADAAKMTEMMSNNPDMLKNMSKSMQNMDPDQLQKMGISPDQAAQLGDTVQNMDPKTLQMLMKWGGRAAKLAAPFVAGYQKVRSVDRQTMLHIFVLLFAGLILGHLTNSF